MKYIHEIVQKVKSKKTGSWVRVRFEEEYETGSLSIALSKASTRIYKIEGENPTLINGGVISSKLIANDNTI